MADNPTCTRYFLKLDGTLDPVQSPGRCATYWRLREVAITTEPETAGFKEMQIKLRVHEQRCPHCRQYFADCERFSLNQVEHTQTETDLLIPKGMSI